MFPWIWAQRRWLWSHRGWSLPLAAVVVGPLAWGIVAIDDRRTFVIDYLGLLANLVMGGAALGAFALWRDQMRGQADHDVSRLALKSALQLKSAIESSMSSVTAARLEFESQPSQVPSPPSEWSMLSRQQIVGAIDGTQLVGSEVVAQFGEDAKASWEALYELASLYAVMLVQELPAVLNEQSDAGARSARMMLEADAEAQEQLKAYTIDWRRLFADDADQRKTLNALLKERVAAVETWAVSVMGRTKLAR